MEALKKIVRDRMSRSTPATSDEIFNLAREYLQILTLKLIYQSKFGGALSFMGGTCLRICYDLKRYSEDLDFALDDRMRPTSFSQLIAHLKKELELLGFDVSTNVHEDKIVQKAFLKFAGLVQALNMTGVESAQKIHIKLEVDVRPPPLAPSDRESFFVNRFGEIFPVLKHTLPTLFAGKILALLFRPYPRGRDYYDLIWYLTRKTELNLPFLNKGMKGKPFRNVGEVYNALREKIETVKPAVILKDIGRFLEDPKEATWIERYPELFSQLAASILNKPA